MDDDVLSSRFLSALAVGVALAAFGALLFEFPSLRGLYTVLFWPCVLIILGACFWVFAPLLAEQEMFAFRFAGAVSLAAVSFLGIIFVCAIVYWCCAVAFHAWFAA